LSIFEDFDPLSLPAVSAYAKKFLWICVRGRTRSLFAHLWFESETKREFPYSSIIDLRQSGIWMTGRIKTAQEGEVRGKHVMRLW